VDGPWGIADSYLDDRGVERRPGAETVRLLTAAIGSPAPAALGVGAELRPGVGVGVGPIVTGASWRAVDDGVVECEGGGEQPVTRGRTAVLPLGYHHLRTRDGNLRSVIAAPPRCVRPTSRQWGLTVQLYAARSRRSWGIGDLSDLRAIGESAAAAGAGFLLVNPMHAAAPVAVQEDCPYAPVSRLFRHPLYLDVRAVPGAGSVDLTAAAAAGTKLNGSRLIDRSAVWQVKREALLAIHATGAARDGFTAWQAGQGPELGRFAVWCALSEDLGASTTSWPAALRDSGSPAVARFAAEHARTVDFHQWLQWLLVLQGADSGIGVVHDLAVGVSADGADAWIWPDAFVAGVTIGAPPDSLNVLGQDWGLAPLDPGHLQATDYEPFVRLVRATLAGSAGIRIDHVLGLFRLWLVPSGAGAPEGGYVRYPAADLLAVLALESHRSGVPIIGEDLGMVESGVRETLDAHGLLSSRVLLLDEQDPRHWPAGSVASTSTHDLPTVAGLWSGIDVGDQVAAGVPGSAAATATLRDRLADVLLLTGTSDARPVPPAAVVTAAHAALAQAPSLLTAVSLEDLTGATHRPNIPATNRPENWTRPLPVLVEDLPVLLAPLGRLLDIPSAADTGQSLLESRGLLC